MKKGKIYQIQIALRHFRPKIWRRVLVPADLPLSDFHSIIQTTMGWYNGHLHQFRKGRNEYAPPARDEFWEATGIDYSDLKIEDLLKKEKDKIIYDYDFGDSWEHDIILEKILPYDEGIDYPVCIKGKMACPPEDCGGVWGYADLLEIISNPKHEEYEEMMDWLGEDFDPEYFDIETVNELLQNDEDYGTPNLF